MFPQFGSPQLAAPLEVVSRTLFHFDANRPDYTDGILRTETGHLGAFSRGVTLASVLDSLGGTYTAVDAQPAWEMRDDGAGGQRMGLRMGTSDRLAFDAPPVLGPFRLLLEFTETGARIGTAGGTLFALCNDAVSGGRIWIDTSGTASGRYGINYSNGTTTRTARVSSGAPVSGDRVQLIADFADTGALSFSQRINGAAATTASAAALAIVALGSGARIRLNSRGDTENPASASYHLAKLVYGAPSDETLLAIR